MQTEGRSRGQSESYNQNTQRLGRELMTPSELATMPGDKCILQLRGLPPFFSSKYDLKQHPNYKYTAEADKKKNAFDLDKLINRRRRPGLNEACEVYEVDVSDSGARKRGRGHPQLRRRGRSGCLCINHFWTKCPEVATCRPNGRLFSWPGQSPEKWRLYGVLSLPLSTTLQTLVCCAGRWPGRVGRCPICWRGTARTTRAPMLMYGKEASNRKQEIDRQHYTIPNQRPKDKHCGKI